jgi:Domain of unknown function (DUF222)/HNH endonuclease
MISPMGALRSGLDEYRSADLGGCTDGEIEEDVCDMKAAIRGLEAECARRISELERRRSFERDGHLSITSWVESRFGIVWSQAAREVRVARALDHMPAVREALADGVVSTSAVNTLVSAQEANPEEFARSEETLLDAARSLPARDLLRAVEQWKSAAEPTVVAREFAERYERRGLQMSSRVDGMIRVDGNLDPDTGGTVMTALRAVTDGWRRWGSDDPRSPAQRRADALGEVCRGWLDRSDRPAVGGERPHVTVVVDLATLEGRTEGGSETAEGTRISPEAVRRLACDAVVSRVITAGRTEPLEAGRSTRVVAPSLRRALAVRDGGCAFPNCDRPVSWCDAHHVRHWADGGTTDLSNLVLLCRRHHTLTHRRFGIQMVKGRPVFRRPDGSVIEPRRSLEGTAPP